MPAGGGPTAGGGRGRPPNCEWEVSGGVRMGNHWIADR